MRLLNIKKTMHCLRSIKIIGVVKNLYLFGVVHSPSKCGQVMYSFVLKDLSINYISKYNKDPFWMNKTNIKTLKHILSGS